MSDALTLEQFKCALPAQIKPTINQELIDQINSSLADRESMEIYKENLISFTSVLQQGKFKLANYVNAVRYVGFKVMGSTNLDAYIKTFPDKYQKFKLDDVSEKDISSYVTAYNKGKLVNLIFELSLIPTHILNAPLYQKALNTQSWLMENAKSEMVRMQAANSLLIQLKAPEVHKVELDIGMDRGDIIKDYEIAMGRMVAKQRELIAAGGNIKQIVNAAIPAAVDADIIDI